MRKLIFAEDREICAWVGERVGMAKIEGATIGVSDGGMLIAGVVYNGFTGRDVQVTMASATKRWATKGVLRALFFYPFVQLGCVRITCAVETHNRPVRDFLLHLGFVEEGVLRQWFDTGDAVVYGLLRSDCPWVKGYKHDDRQAA